MKSVLTPLTKSALMQVAVTSNFLAKRSSFGESSVVLTNVNYRELQRTVKRKWKFLISNLKILIHFLLSLLASHKNEMLVLWLAFNYIKPQQKLQKQSFADVLLNRCS